MIEPTAPTMIDDHQTGREMARRYDSEPECRYYRLRQAVILQFQFSIKRKLCVCVRAGSGPGLAGRLSPIPGCAPDVNVDQKSIITQVEWGLIRPICLSEWTFNHGERFVSGLGEDQFGSIFDLTAFIFTCLRL